MSGKMLVNANRLITDFITGRIQPVKYRLTLTGKNGPKCVIDVPRRVTPATPF